jgi:hypothetical protein
MDVKIGHNQERVTSDLYKGVKNLWWGGTRSIESSFDVHIWGIERVLIDG